MKLIAGLIASLAAVARADDWAVIVAGSNGYGNYRHQADACHAYQIVSKWGIPDERIITMIYDDVANNFENPYKGQLFNKPTDQGTPGVDVYKGCKIDYAGKDNNPDNFLAVLTGDSKATKGKPVLKSTKQDRVFINFADHGGTGSIAFPGMVLLSAKKLNDALKQMYQNQMYEKLVFYMEACESGSMFQGLLDPSLNIYATTAANARESSWGTYCPPNDRVNGKSLNSCLGDLYSVNWMENSESVGQQETLEKQFQIVKQLTNKSHVMQFGDTSFTDQPIGDFMGGSSSISSQVAPRKPGSNSDVTSRDVPVHLAYYKYLRSSISDMDARRQARAALRKSIAEREFADDLFYGLSQTVASRQLKSSNSIESATALADRFFAQPADIPFVCEECCDYLNEVYKNKCGNYNDYSLQYTRVVTNMCNYVNHDKAAYQRIGEDMTKQCTSMMTRW